MFPDKRVLLSRFHRWGHSHDAHARHADWNLVLRFTRKPRESLRSPTWNVDNVWQSSRNSCNSIVNHCVRWTPRGTNRVSCRGRWMQIDPFSHCVIGELDIMCVVNCPVATIGGSMYGDNSECLLNYFVWWRRYSGGSGMNATRITK